MGKNALISAPAFRKSKKSSVNNLVVVSDTHCGCRLGLCPGPIPLDDGGVYQPSKAQQEVWGLWETFWGEWVPEACHHEPYAVLVNGDALDGVHHNAVSQISHNLADQALIAEKVFKPLRDRCEGRLYWIRGTEAHVGASGMEEERLAKSIGAIPDAEGRHARYELWLQLGEGLIHATHHVGATGTSHYESTAVLKELIEAYTEAGRNRDTPPDIVVRSHRHRLMEIRVPTRLGYGIVFVTPGWQLKTPFTYRLLGGRATTPQIGGSLIRQGDCDLYTRHRVWGLKRAPVEQL